MDKAEIEALAKACVAIAKKAQIDDISYNSAEQWRGVAAMSTMLMQQAFIDPQVKEALLQK